MLYAGKNLVGIRNDTVDGVGPWVWATADISAWECPKSDWENGHREKILRYVPEQHRRVVVQAGGNMGMYPRLLSSMFDAVYTFEPDPLNFHCLVANCQRDNIVKINAALGYRHQMVSISSDRFVDAAVNYGVREVVQRESSHIPTFMIDDLDLKHCDLIMLDTEGYELNVLKGANETLEKFHPVIFAEFAEPCIPYLQAFGYEAIDKSFGDIIFVRTK